MTKKVPKEQPLSQQELRRISEIRKLVAAVQDALNIMQYAVGEVCVFDSSQFPFLHKWEGIPGDPLSLTDPRRRPRWFAIQHVGNHLVADAGKLMGLCERRDHDEREGRVGMMNQAELEKVCVRLFVDTLHLAHVAGLDGTALSTAFFNLLSEKDAENKLS